MEPCISSDCESIALRSRSRNGLRFSFAQIFFGKYFEQYFSFFSATKAIKVIFSSDWKKISSEGKNLSALRASEAWTQKNKHAEKQLQSVNCFQFCLLQCSRHRKDTKMCKEAYSPSDGKTKLTNRCIQLMWAQRSASSKASALGRSTMALQHFSSRKK